MKKKYLTWAGIISAVILTGMFLAIFFSSGINIPLLNPGTSNALSGNGDGSTEKIPENVLQNGTARATPTVPVTNVTPTSPVGGCTNTARFIAIDSLPVRESNQTYTLTGTTSISSNETLLVKILPLEYTINVNPKTHVQSGEFSGIEGVILIINGSGSINTWSFKFNTSGMNPDITNYLVNVSNDRFDPQTSGIIYGNTFCTSKFTRED